MTREMRGSVNNLALRYRQVQQAQEMALQRHIAIVPQPPRLSRIEELMGELENEQQNTRRAIQDMNERDR